MSRIDCCPQIIRTVEELEALDPDTVVYIDREFATFQYADCTVPVELPTVVIRDGAEVRAARNALGKETNIDRAVKHILDDDWDLPLHRTEAGYPNCATCDGGGCPDCTDPA